MIAEEKKPPIKAKINEFSKNLYLSLLCEGKAVYINAWGMSMYPFIKNGDRIKIAPMDKREVKIGDIIAVDMKKKEGPWFFVHRVVKIAKRDDEERVYFTKGDAQKKSLDDPVTIELIAGKVTQIQRRGLEINLEITLWRHLNNIIAKLSFRYPEILCFLSRYISLIIEWRLFLYKVRNRLKKGTPLFYNTEELLLICARKDLNQELKNKACELIKQGLNWEQFCASAIRSQVTILVYNALNSIASYTLIPKFVFNLLKSDYLLIVSRAVSQHEELVGLLKFFAQKKIAVLPLKGTLLAKRLYGDIASRGLSMDFDLLIREENKDRTKNILEEMGYQLNEGDDVKKWQWQYNFSKQKAMPIDLHWDITYWDITPLGRSQERIEGPWQGTRLVEVDNINYYEFKQEKLLLYLSCHLVNSSCFRELRYICDINELLCRYKDALDWNDIIEKARRWQLSNSLYAAIKLSKDFFGSDVSNEVLRELKPSFLKIILLKIFANKKVVLRNGLRRRLIDTYLCYIFFALIEARGFREYLSIAKRVLFPPEEVLLNTKKEEAKPLYLRYIIRLIKGIIKLLRLR